MITFCLNHKREVEMSRLKLQRRALVISSFGMVMVIFFNGFSYGDGFLQINCIPGVKIYLDGKYIGTTTADHGAEGGLDVSGVSPGSHSLRAEKEGYNPINLTVIVNDNRTSVVLVEFKERRKVSADHISTSKQTAYAREEVGSLEADSFPPEADVYLDQEYLEKTKLRASSIPPGWHRISFKRGAESLQGDIFIKPNHKLELLANFTEQKIKVSSEVKAFIYVHGETYESQRTSFRVKARGLAVATKMYGGGGNIYNDIRDGRYERTFRYIEASEEVELLVYTTDYGSKLGGRKKRIATAEYSFDAGEAGGADVEIDLYVSTTDEYIRARGRNVTLIQKKYTIH